MSKKNIVLILIITAIFSIMALSLWGKAAESGNRTDATAICFRDADGNILNEKEESLDDVTVVNIETSDTNHDDIIYKFSVEILPDTTTDDSLVYLVLNSDAKFEEITVPSSEETVINRFHTYQFTFSEQQRDLTTVRFTYNTGGNPKLAYLKITWTIKHSQDIPD